MNPADFHQPSLTDVAYKELRRGILRGELPPGRKLVVNDLVDEWKISNTPIKEALNRLVAEELVEALPRKGMRVRKYNARETREIFEIRTLYEVHCCRLAASGPGPDLLSRLDAILDECRGIIIQDGPLPLRVFDLDADFHRLVICQCGNETLIRDFDRLHAHTLTIGISVNARQPLRRWKETQAEHEDIVSALRGGSPDEAQKAICVHLENTSKDLLAFFNPISGRLQQRKYETEETEDL